MSARRTVILVVAVAVGVLSAFLVFNYVSSADDRAQSNARQATVLRVKQDIPRGMTGREADAKGYIESTEIQAKFKPATAINNKESVFDKVAVADLAAGQVLVTGMFADPVESQITYAGRVPDQCGPTDPATNRPTPCVAITLSFDQIRGVAGVIVPGDFVNILALPKNDICEKTTDQANSGQTPQVSIPADASAVICKPARYVYQAVQVLFVDRSVVPQAGETTATTVAGQAAANGGLITFAVPPKAAQLLASIAGDSLYLTLLPSDYTPVPLPALDPFVANLPAEDQSQLTPYGPQGIQSK